MADNKENRDMMLFDKIADSYARKDHIKATAIYRNFTNKFILNQFNNKEFGNIVDVGCASGAVSEVVDKSKFKYIGIDYSEELIRIGRKVYGGTNVEFIEKNIKDSSIPRGIADLIFMNGALHHMDDIDESIKAIKMISKNGARLIAIEPLGENPIIQIMRKIRSLVDKNYSSEQVFFKKKDLVEIMHRNGLNVKLYEFGYMTPPFAQVIMPSVISMSIYPFAVIIDRAMFLLNKFVKMGLAWNIIIVGDIKK